MTIAEKLLKVAENEPKVYKAGREKGYSEGYIDGTSGTAFETDSSIAYRKIAPSAPQKLAQVLEVGGMTYKCNNLIPFPYLINTATQIGLTATVNNDGSIRLKGTATEVGRFNVYFISKLPIVFSKGTTFSYAKMEGSTHSTYLWRVILIDKDENAVMDCSSVETATKTLETDSAYMYLDINYWTTAVGENVDITFYPMFNYGTTALPYEPYFEGLRSTKVTSLKSEGANLIPFPYSDGMSKTVNGITYTVNADGSIHAVGTATAEAIFTLTRNTKWASTSIWASEKVTSVDGKTFYQCQFSNSGSYPLYVRVVANETVDKTFYPMVNYGTETAPFTPYIGTLDTLAIPEAVQSLEGYGLGVDSTYYNYIDYERKVFVQNVEKVTFDGTEGWYIPTTVQDSESRYYQAKLQLAPLGYDKGIANYYDFSEVGIRTTGKGWYLLASSYIRVRPDLALYPDVASWKAHLAERYASGNPLTVVYKLAEPIETDISAYLTEDNLIEVEGGGTITAVNEHALATPSKIQFVSKVGG